MMNFLQKVKPGSSFSIYIFSDHRAIIVNLTVPGNCVRSCWKDVFEGAWDFAREWVGLLWEDSKRMRLVAKYEVHNQMSEFLTPKESDKKGEPRPFSFLMLTSIKTWETIFKLN